MIVVIGTGCLTGSGDDARPASLADRIALAAAAAGAGVERVARVGDDAAGDAWQLALARAGVGHVAVLRDPARRTASCDRVDLAGDGDALDAAEDLALDAVMDAADDAMDDALRALEPSEEIRDLSSPAVQDAGPTLDRADVGLALRYLTDYRVVIAVHPSADVAGEAIVAADWARAHAVVVTRPDEPIPPTVPPGTLVLEADPAPGAAAGLAARLGAYGAAIDGGQPAARAYGALTAELDLIGGDRAG